MKNVGFEIRLTRLERHPEEPPENHTQNQTFHSGLLVRASGFEPFICVSTCCLARSIQRLSLALVGGLCSTAANPSFAPGARLAETTYL
jgi:hypothetical protein